MRKMTFRFAVTCSLVLLAFQGLSVGQTQSVAAPPKIKASISIDSTTLSRDSPAVVTITLENTSGQELEISSITSFDLRNLSKESVSRKMVIVGDRYWSPVNITSGTPTQLNIMDPEKLKQGIVVGRVPEVTLKFAKDETKTFKVDLTKTLWNDSMSNVWGEEDLFKIVPKGSYALSLSLSKKGANLESNAVQVSVK